MVQGWVTLMNDKKVGGGEKAADRKLRKGKGNTEGEGIKENV